jgi:hypothetical protein
MDLLFERDRVYLHKANGSFGAIPLSVSGGHSWPAGRGCWVAGRSEDGSSCCRQHPTAPLHSTLIHAFTIPMQSCSAHAGPSRAC